MRARKGWLSEEGRRGGGLRARLGMGGQAGRGYLEASTKCGMEGCFGNELHKTTKNKKFNEELNRE